MTPSDPTKDSAGPWASQSVRAGALLMVIVCIALAKLALNLALGRLLGDSLYAIRFPAALAGAVTVVLTGLMARKLGGGRFAQLLAAAAVALSPVVLGNAGRFFSMNAFDLLFWALGSTATRGCGPTFSRWSMRRASPIITGESRERDRNDSQS
jgi:hypothetical protein